MAKASIPTPPRSGFTDVYLKNLKPQTQRFEIGDPGKKSLRLRVSPGGAKTFVWLCQTDGKMRRVNLGNYGQTPSDISLQKARQALDKAKQSHKNGILHTADSDAPKTVSDLADVFYKRRILPHRKRPDEAKRILDKDIVPVIGKRRLQTIIPATVTYLIEGVVDRGAATHAGKVLAICKQMFRFAVARGWMESNPAQALGRATRRLLSLKVERNGEKIPLLDIPSFSPHDLRRTMRTRMGENLKIPPHIAERCLNHSLGRIADTYDQGDYLDERRQALQRWADYVMRAVNGESNVVEIRA